MTDKTIQKANPNVDDVDALVRRTMFANQPADLVNMTLLICQRYDLDPLLKHVVLIKGNIYVTRDGLLHVAHQSGQLNGMHVTLGKDDFGMFAECTIYRRDMAHPFTYRVYRDEYDSKTGAWRTHPRAMLIKTAEVFSLRRAFDVALTPIEEMDTVIDRHQPDPPSRPASNGTQAQPEAVEGEVVEEGEPAPKAEASKTPTRPLSLEHLTGWLHQFIGESEKDDKDDEMETTARRALGMTLRPIFANDDERHAFMAAVIGKDSITKLTNGEGRWLYRWAQEAHLAKREKDDVMASIGLPDEGHDEPLFPDKPEDIPA